MPHRDPIALDRTSPPFDRYKSIQWLAPARRGHQSPGHARHHLYVGRPKDNPVNVLIKVTSKPGLVYEQDVTNEIESLVTINRELPDSRYFPIVHEHGRLDDGRVYLMTSFFDEFPLVTQIDAARNPHKLVGHLRTAIEVARALTEIHGLEIFHVDLNPMNILYGTARSSPVIRIVDFESSYDRSRHTAGDFYSPPTTPGYSAPEVANEAPDARADLFSLGAVLHTLVAGYSWTEHGDVAARVAVDRDLDAELRDVLLVAVDPVRANRYPSVREFQRHLAVYLERIWPGRAW